MGKRGLVWAFGLGCAACGGSEAASTPPADAGADQVGGAGGTASGGSGGSGAIAGDGYVFVTQSAGEHRIIATFDVWQPGPLCTFRNAGPCRLDQCTEPTLRAEAGEVAVEVGAVRRTATLDGAGTYSGSWTGQLWQPGETIRITAAGAGAPAIDQTVTGPAPLTLIEPVPNTDVGASRTQPFRARWSGGSNGTAVVAFAGTAVNGQSLHVKCSFDVAAGEGTLPAGALADLDPARSVTLISFVESYRTLDTGGWFLRVAARTESIAVNVALQ